MCVCVWFIPIWSFLISAVYVSRPWLHLRHHLRSSLPRSRLSWRPPRCPLPLPVETLRKWASLSAVCPPVSKLTYTLVIFFFFSLSRRLFLTSFPSALEPQGVSSEEGINLEEIREFAKNFKIRRLSLGLTQTQVGQALTATEGPAYSQSAICR